MPEVFDREQWALDMFERLSDHECEYAKVGVWTTQTHGVIRCTACQTTFAVIFRNWDIFEVD